MKVGIITFHFVNNFGGVLQAYALANFLKENIGVNVEIINYENKFIKFTDIVRLFPITKNKKAFFSGMKTFKYRLRRMYIFNLFRKKYLHLSTKKYLSGRALKRNPPIYDKYICGSDQIWNPIITGGVDLAYYLDFVTNKENTCAYAPSFGTNHIYSVFAKKMSKNIANIKYLSVREKQSIGEIRKWVGRIPQNFIDPTFLLEADQWSKIADYKEKLPEKYILIYIMQSDYSVYEYVSKIKQKYKYPVIDISRYGYKPGFVDRTVIDIGPIEFLALFRDAEIVCTNSYHGLVYSLIFNKKLFLIPSKKFALRMVNLLEVLEIDNVDLLKLETITEIKYDYKSVKKIIHREREKSYKYINDFLLGK